MTGPTRRTILSTAAATTLIAPKVARATAAGPVVPPAYKALSPRERIRFDFDWRFKLGHAADINRDFDYGQDQETYAKQGVFVAAPCDPQFDDSTWQSVALPHDWAIDLPFAPNPNPKPGGDPEDGDGGAAHGYKAIGRLFPENSVGWYRKVFTLDKADETKHLTIEFDGVFRDATVILNGYILTRHESGYSPFSVDISDFINTDGPNILLVRVDASLGEGWFYEGAGIYRHVWLVKTAQVHIPQWGVWVHGDTKGQVTLETRLANLTDQPKTVQITSRLYDAAGTEVAQTTSPSDIAAQAETSLNQAVTIAAPHLWSLDDPYLYTVRSEVHDGDTLIDVTTTDFGLRDIRFDAQTGFYLNGRPLKIKGINNHQDHAGVGVAIPDSLQAWRVAQMKGLGANTWRCSHNPPTPELLDACDRLGMLVIDETRLMTSTPDGLSQLETLIRRDRNHPSVILWSIGNEENAQQGTARGLKIALKMRRTIKALDPYRPVTAAMNHGNGYGITPALDVMGFNYHEANIEAFRKLYPDMPIVGTETASSVSTRGEYVRDSVKGYVRSYDLDKPSWGKTAEEWWTLYNAKPYLAGGLVWTGFDYRGEPTPFNRWPEISSHFGILDTCGFPKDIAYYYRSWWQDAPVLHLLPHWDWVGQEGKPISVWAYSNLDAVELFVNGKSAGRQTMVKDSHLEWSIPYAAGEITAYGYKNGQVVMKASRRTSGPAYRLTLACDRQTLSGDGQDTAMLKVEVVDKAGTPVARAANLVNFHTEGDVNVIGVGNGNPTSHEPDRATSRFTFNALAQGIVQSARNGRGRAVITVSSPGLLSASHVLGLTA